MTDSFSVIFIFMSNFVSCLFEKYLEHFCAHTVFTLEHIFLYTVDTGGGDGTANFTELDSDYSEPGKHV